jgi:hypothetical protein
VDYKGSSDIETEALESIILSYQHQTSICKASVIQRRLKMDADTNLDGQELNFRFFLTKPNVGGFWICPMSMPTSEI